MYQLSTGISVLTQEMRGEGPFQFQTESRKQLALRLFLHWYSVFMDFEGSWIRQKDMGVEDSSLSTNRRCEETVNYSLSAVHFLAKKNCFSS